MKSLKEKMNRWLRICDRKCCWSWDCRFPWPPLGSPSASKLCLAAEKTPKVYKNQTSFRFPFPFVTKTNRSCTSCRFLFFLFNLGAHWASRLPKRALPIFKGMFGSPLKYKTTLLYMLNNITHIFTHSFTHMYIKNTQTTLHKLTHQTNPKN